ncbi:CATRA system-associated protein [Actinophytocola sp. NPDC049390]|uniref:CATRA system-associated protein n=1 Tax=Actinophytocola sp. NPDC049390 TaxID=3363894 RepID=UPI0037A9AAAB
MAGTVVTFYSFKGGVGRSFALSNIAILLARWGYRVLTIDWDLEAPGLPAYFKPLLKSPPTTGIIDLVDDFAASAQQPSSAYITELELDEPGTVHLLAAGGQHEDDYARRVQSIDWAALYAQGFADALELCRAEWTEAYDFVLIDSRTGFADIASICTAHLPDHLVVLFTANDQSVGGALDVVRRADKARDRMPYDRPQLTALPVLSRFDSRVEYERAESWYRTCTELTTPLFGNWLVHNVSPSLMLRHLTLPYVSYWSFGEQLPVLAERVPSANQIAYALETIAAVVAHKLDRSDLLADNRDAFVTAARGQPRDFAVDILVSTPRSTLGPATALVRDLRALGVRAESSLSGDVDFLAHAQDAARHLCLVIDGQVSRWQTAEAEWFLRRTLAADTDRRLFPVLTSATDPRVLPGFLRNLRHLELGPLVASNLHAEVVGDNPVPAPRADPAQVYTDASATAERSRTALLTYTGWHVVERTVRAMANATRDGDVKRMRVLVAELEAVIAPAVQDNGRVAIPGNVADLVTALLSRLGWRIREMSNR